MTKYIALLRGINVSGQKFIRMADLVGHLSPFGYSDVQTYLQSGNLLFSAGKSTVSTLAAEISAGIAQEYGFDVKVIVLTATDLDRIVQSNPFSSSLQGDDKLFHATFFFEPVSVAAFQKLTLPVRAEERAVLCGQVVMLYCPEGYGKTKLTNNYFEKALGVTATTRNWRTLLALQKLSGGSA
ncbi:MAG: DUF1697 domain-containing protein [Gammaproteobacteria bacterium]|nr:DUF1697 domain-containing protein [Gammaproteobacteria bacterium]